MVSLETGEVGWREELGLVSSLKAVDDDLFSVLYSPQLTSNEHEYEALYCRDSGWNEVWSQQDLFDRIIASSSGVLTIKKESGRSLITCLEVDSGEVRWEKEEALELTARPGENMNDIVFVSIDGTTKMIETAGGEVLDEFTVSSGKYSQIPSGEILHVGRGYARLLDLKLDKLELRAL